MQIQTEKVVVGRKGGFRENEKIIGRWIRSTAIDAEGMFENDGVREWNATAKV